MTFRTQFGPHFRSIQPSGNRVHTLYSGSYTDTGEFVLESSGTEDLYDKIQSHSAGVDIHVILDRFRRGDIEALGDAQRASYLDISELPHNYAQLLNTVNACEQSFMTLPVEERAKYGHSFVQWLMSQNKSSDTELSSVSEATPEVSTNE